MDDGACLYYKLSYDPKGSGELMNLKLLTIAIFFFPNIAKHKIFSANKYENANNKRKFHAQLRWAWKKVL